MSWKQRPDKVRAKLVRPAAAAIAEALQLRGISDEVRAGRLMTEWIDLAGERIAAKTRPHGIFERVLHIEVATAAWLHELTLLKPQLLNGLLARFGEPRLFDDLRFVRRTRLEAPPRWPTQTPRPPKPPSPIAATGAARDAIEKDVERVEDPELRELIARVRIANGR